MRTESSNDDVEVAALQRACVEAEATLSESQLAVTTGALWRHDRLVELAQILTAATHNVVAYLHGSTPDPQRRASLVVRSIRLQRSLQEEQGQEERRLRQSLLLVARALHWTQRFDDALEAVRESLQQLAGRGEILFLSSDPMASNRPAIETTTVRCQNDSPTHVEIPIRCDVDLDWRLRAEQAPQAGPPGPMTRTYLEAVADLIGLAWGGRSIDSALETHIGYLEREWCGLRNEVDRLVTYDDGADCAIVLTPREREVLTQVQKGESNAAIAATLYVSVETIKTHVKSLLRKYRVPNRSALIALRLTLTPSEE